MISRLKSGVEVPSEVLATVMVSLHLLMESNALALYELRELCRDSDHRIFGSLHAPLLKLGLIAESGASYAIHDTVRHVVLSAVSGEGLGLTLVNPVEATR